MGFKVDMGGAKEKIRAICSDARVGQFAAETFAQKDEQYVPRLEGALAGSAVVSPFLVTYIAPYAHYQWEGKYINDANRTTEDTHSHWEEYVNKDEMARDITKYLKGMQ